jgi:predicted nucleotidyltransferase
MNSYERTLRELCGSEDRYRIIRTLYSRPTERFHLRGLAQAAGVDPSNASRLLVRLVEANLCERTATQLSARYGARHDNPLYQELVSLFQRGSDLVIELEKAANSLSGADIVFIYGSFARGEDLAESDIDIFVIGETSTVEALAHFRPVGRKFERKIGVSVMSMKHLLKALESGATFEMDVFTKPQIMLKGEVPNEIARAIRGERIEGLSPSVQRQRNDRKSSLRR